MAEVNKSMNNLYSIVDFEGSELLMEVPLNNISERELLKFNLIFTEINYRAEILKEDFSKDLIMGFKPAVYNILNDVIKDDDKTYDLITKFDTFIQNTLLNCKVYFKGKEMTYPEFINVNTQGSEDVNFDNIISNSMKLNICFFLSTYIMCSNSLKLKKVKNMIELFNGTLYIGSSTIGEFHSFVVSLKAENSLKNASQA